MTSVEFNIGFKELHSRYPGFPMPEPKMVGKIWFEDLKFFSLAILRQAIPEVLRVSPQFFPACGIVKAMCEAAQALQNAAGRFPRPRFYPMHHDCRAEAGRHEIGEARQKLFRASYYEGIHVLCLGPIAPVCPWCGIIQSRWENPYILVLKEQYPVETEQWNVEHKGTLLCEKCQGLRYPQDFISWVK